MLETKEAAFVYVCKYLEEHGHKIRSVQNYNLGRHRLIQTNKGIYYMIFKREFFYSFKKQFPQWSKQNPTGYGESINMTFLNMALAKGATLLFIYPDKKIYKIYPNVVKNVCEKNNLTREQEKINKYNRMNFSGSTKSIKEITYSFPLCLLERF